MSLLKALSQILKNQGPRYVIYRSLHEFKARSGLLKRKFPSSPPGLDFPSYTQWKSQCAPFIFSARKTTDISRTKHAALEARVQKWLSGSTLYFNREWKQVDGWHENPSSGYHYPKDRHWSQIPDLSPEAGDIKYAWEKSRFSFICDLIRYDHHFGECHATFVFDQVFDWIDENPVNLGPNYRCSQEISLRCLNWISAIYFYQDDLALTQAQWQKLLNSIYWQVRHVRDHIHFSRICVRNNHAITECMMLYFAGLLFPFFPDASDWKRKGKRWLEEEIAYQVYPDGTYLQYSHNYQRVLLQLLTWTIALSKIHGEDLQATTLERAQLASDYMHNCCVGQKGKMPNYGSNDGALFFRLDDCDYTDYRPQINALHAVLHGTHLYDNAGAREDALWVCQNLSLSNAVAKSRDSGKVESFEKGGIFTCRDDNAFTFFKCTAYRDRPAQADNMHLDIWVDGLNCFRDSGTYLYNTDPEIIRYFIGTRGHNSVLIDDLDQMTKGPRFIWYDWTREAACQVLEKDDEVTFRAQAKMFHASGNGLWHFRTVTYQKGECHWIIEDAVPQKEDGQKMTQVWHPNPVGIEKVTIKATDQEGNKIRRTVEEGFWSAYYGQKEEVPMWVYETSGSSIRTEIRIQAWKSC